MQTSSQCFFTICLRKEAAHAACLGESLQRQHPGCEFTVWLLDEGPTHFESGSLRTRWVGEILEELDLIVMGNREGFESFARSVKPHLFQHHFSTGASAVAYLEPATYLFSPMTELEAALKAGATGVLVPRASSPMPNDGKLPDDRSVLRDGMFDPSILALSAGTKTTELLQWWRDRIRDDPHADPHWMTLATIYWNELETLRHPGYGVSYWNLHERSLHESHDSAWSVGEARLVSFHFDGYQCDDRLSLSSLQTRVTVAPGSPLSRILHFYSERLIDQGVRKAQRIVAEPATFLDGARFDKVALSVLLQSVKDGLAFDSLRGLEPSSFRTYLYHVPPGQARSVYIRKLFELRGDLVGPLGNASDAEIHRWIRVSGAPELGLDPKLIEPPRESRELRDLSFVGYLLADLGIGQAARGHVAALRHAGFSASLIDVSDTTSSSVSSDAIAGVVTRELHPSAVVIIELNADHLRKVMSRLDLGSVCPDAYRIGVWAWETMDFPDKWIPEFSLVDEVWCGSEFVAQAIAQKSPVPVMCMPYCVEVPAIAPNKASFGLREDEFVFLFTFDFLSIFERKNPYAAISAFREAFSPKDPVRLFVKSMNASRRPEQFERLKLAAEGLNVTFLDGGIDSEARYRLIASCDAYVSLHRAEGFGLGMAEAMSYGKPVIATGWSGNMDFMTPWNSYLVDFRLALLENETAVYPKDTLWALPDLQDAARNLRLAWEDGDLRTRRGARAQQDIQEMFSPSAVGRRMGQRLDLIGRLEPHRRIDPDRIGGPFDTKTPKPMPLGSFSPTKVHRALEILRSEGLRGLKRRLIP